MMNQPQMQNPYANMGSYLTEPSWIPVISPYLQIPQQNLIDVYASGQQIFPAPNQTFAAFNTLPLDQVKVVILGQDPYPNSLACGLAFSAPGASAIPYSLNNIFKCIQNDPSIPFIMPSHSDLSNWTTQGVFLLNTILTVGSTPLSHAHFGWEAVTDNVIKEISSTQNHVVFILLGNNAQAKSCLIDQTRNTVLTSYHPASWGLCLKTFLESKIFSACNEALARHGQAPINWQI